MNETEQDYQDALNDEFINGPNRRKNPMTDADKTRIEKDAIDYVIKETGHEVLPEHDHWKNAYIAGATRMGRTVEEGKEQGN